MIMSHAKQLKPGSPVIAFNGKATLYARVSSVESARGRVLISVRYKKKDGSIGDMRRSHRGFCYDSGFPSANFPTVEELGIETANG